MPQTSTSKSNFQSEEYWSQDYWEKYLEKNKDKKTLDFTTDNWLEKYRPEFNKIKKGQALDLGSGLGQDTQFLLNEGFEVVSADISHKALQELKKKIPVAQTIQLDMTRPLPFQAEEFNLIFANLSVHYFSWSDTVNLFEEIKRILKKDGYFIGRVNSIKTMANDVKNPIKIEENYYFDKRYLRYFNQQQFDILFKDWQVIILNETTTQRWERTKVLWEFIVKKKS